MLLKTGQVAARLGVSREKVRQLCISGDLPCYKIGSQYRVDPDALTAWLEGQKPVAPGRKYL